MTCCICGRNSCALWMHSQRSQDEYQKLQEDLEKSTLYLYRYLERGLPQESEEEED